MKEWERERDRAGERRKRIERQSYCSISNVVIDDLSIMLMIYRAAKKLLKIQLQKKRKKGK